jgi:hypothetical protein
MKLVYRGLSYQATSSHLESINPELNGKYRGIDYQIGEVKNTAIKNICVLRYRGVDYIKILH